MKATILPAARDDIIRQFRYYLVDQDQPGIAHRFLRAVRRTIEQIARMPSAGAPKRLRHEALRGLRAWPVKEFEDLRVYYLPDHGLVRVVRILHGKRDIDSILGKETYERPQ